jgi:hypothetical protein
LNPARGSAPARPFAACRRATRLEDKTVSPDLWSIPSHQKSYREFDPPTPEPEVDPEAPLGDEPLPLPVLPLPDITPVEESDDPVVVPLPPVPPPGAAPLTELPLPPELPPVPVAPPAPCANQTTVLLKMNAAAIATSRTFIHISALLSRSSFRISLRDHRE